MQASAEGGLRRPALRRPRIENVEAAEAAKEAAIRAGTAVTRGKHPPLQNSTSATILPGGNEVSESFNGQDNTESTLSHSSSSSSLNADSGNEFSDLRCSSVRTEEIVEREKARQVSRQKRCPDYPGLAFGAPLGFGSDTMMKFNIIKNELHNIMRSQLKRVDGEVSALATRIKEFDANLEKSEQFIKTATCALAETVQLEMERKQKKRENNEDDSDCDESDPLRQFDAQMALLEGKLMQAKHMASQDNTNEHLHLLGSPTKDYSSSPLLPDKKLQEDDDMIVNAAQNKSYGNVHSTTAIRLVNGGNEELMKTDSCHKLTHKTDQETTW